MGDETVASTKTKWVSSKEAAEAAQVNERTVRRWAERGLVEAQLTPSGKYWRIKVNAADGFPVRR